MNADEIFKRCEGDLQMVEEELVKIFRSNVMFIPMIGKHLLKGGGKRIRPLYLLLSAEIAGYRQYPRYLFASIVEAIHTASLLHDDVVDGADVRRGRPTSHSLWGNQIVILVGDFLFANALRLAVGQKDLRIIETLSKSTAEMTEGEILQLQRINDPAITEEEYLGIIAAKTGALISAACTIGGLLGGLPEDKIRALAAYGLKTGIVFQMFDDVLDFTADEAKLGKRLGKDLHEGKITLPLIYLLKDVNDSERDMITEIIKSTDSKKGVKKLDGGLKNILKLFKKYNAIENTINKAARIIAEAKAELDLFEDSPQKDVMLTMADYALLRKK
jgi:octaprenyl-diphosphate synthase